MGSSQRFTSGSPGHRVWLPAGFAVVIGVLFVLGLSPYSLMMGNDDHAGLSHGCPHARVDVQQAEGRSSALLKQTAESIVGAGTPLSAPRFSIESPKGDSNECVVVDGIQDLPGTHDSAAAIAAKLNAPQKIDGYSIALGETSDGRLWLSSTSPPASP